MSSWAPTLMSSCPHKLHVLMTSCPHELLPSWAPALMSSCPHELLPSWAPTLMSSCHHELLPSWAPCPHELHVLYHSRKLSWEKTFKNWWKIRFLQENFCRMVAGHQKMPHTQIWQRKLTEFAKVFSLENSRYTVYVHERTLEWVRLETKIILIKKNLVLIQWKSW